MSDSDEMPPLEEIAPEDDQVISYNELTFGDANYTPSAEDSERARSIVSRWRSSLKRSNPENYCKDAVNELTLAADLDPRLPGVFSTRAEALLLLGEISAAKRDALHSIELAPDSAPCNRVLGKILLRLLDEEGAYKAFSTAAKTDPEDEFSGKMAAQLAAKHAARSKPTTESVGNNSQRAGTDVTDTTEIHSSGKRVFEPPPGLKDPFNVLAEQTGGNGPSSDFLQRVQEDKLLRESAFDDDLQRKLAEAAVSPEKAAEYANDPQFMAVIRGMLNLAAQYRK